MLWLLAEAFFEGISEKFILGSLTVDEGFLLDTQSCRIKVSKVTKPKENTWNQWRCHYGRINS